MTDERDVKRKRTEALDAFNKEVVRYVDEMKKLGPADMMLTNAGAFMTATPMRDGLLDKLKDAFAAVYGATPEAAEKITDKQSKLRRIIHRLLPPDMQHIQVAYARVFDDADEVAHELSYGACSYTLASCAFFNSSRMASHRCAIDIACEKGKYKLFFECKLGGDPLIAPLRVNIDTEDLDQFERLFRFRACKTPPSYGNAFGPSFEYRDALGTRPVWAYVLLSMLVYDEDVFAPLDQRDARRVQTDVDERRVHEVLAKFWTFGRSAKGLNNVIAPFLVRLMPHELALRYWANHDATLFY